MKWFWLAVLALVVGTGALVLLPSGRQTPTSPPPAPTVTSPQATTPAPVAEEPLELRSAPITVLPDEAPTPALPRVEPPAPTPQSADASPATPDPLEQLDELLGLAVESERAPAESLDSALGSRAPIAAATPAVPAEEPEVVTSEKFKEIVKARVRQTDDGWLLFDERFPVRGKGTEDDPFEVSWDLLVSASETYQPRQNKLRLPERITMLDGKRVRITGYVAFPIMAASNDEMLSMRNMWDGCCIGIPPTPYDAIEVRLAEAATGRDRFTSFGTIEGKFVVDPYVKGNWLLGLYLMEDATLSKVRESQGDPARHGM